jgi:hypothetical protein
VGGLIRVLNHNQTELFIRRNHDLMLLGADSDESDNFIVMHLLDLALGLVQEGIDNLTIINRVFLGHGTPDGEALLVDDDRTDNAFVGINAVKSCFNLR